MPLTLRTVEPVDVSLNRIPANVPNRRIDELQCVANGTLANMMRQLGTLSSHGSQLFEDLNKSLEAIDRRLEALGLRSTNLQEKIQMGTGASQEGGLHDNLRRKPYQTANDIDQHSLSRQTLPAAMMELYNQCDAPPRLRELDQFREDGKSALKFYTDPGYFFELWKEQILKECQNDRRMRSARVSSATANLPPGQKSPARRRRQQAAEQQRRPGHNSQVFLQNYSGYQQQPHEYRSVSGILRPANEFVQFPTEYQAPQISRRQADMSVPTGMSRPQLQQQFSASHLYNDDEPLPPPPLNYRPPTVGVGSQSNFSQSLLNTATNSSTPSEIDLPNAIAGVQLGHQQQVNNGLSGATSETSSSTHQPILHIDDEEDELPPPPPPLNSSTAGQGNYAAASGLQFLAPAANADQSLPPAPIANNTQQPAVDSALINSSFGQDSKTETLPANVEIAPVADSSNARNNFLEEIQAGRQLRKVQREEQERAATNANTVAELLKRRMALGYQQDESTDDEKAEDGNDSEWDD